MYLVRSFLLYLRTYLLEFSILYPAHITLQGTKRRLSRLFRGKSIDALLWIYLRHYSHIRMRIEQW